MELGAGVACPTCGAGLNPKRVLDDSQSHRSVDEGDPGESDSCWSFTLDCEGCLALLVVDRWRSAGTTSARVIAPGSISAALRERLLGPRGLSWEEVRGLLANQSGLLLGIPEFRPVLRDVLPDSVVTNVDVTVFTQPTRLDWRPTEFPRLPPRLAKIHIGPGARRDLKNGVLVLDLSNRNLVIGAHEHIRFASGTKFQVLGVARGQLLVACPFVAPPSNVAKACVEAAFVAG